MNEIQEVRREDLIKINETLFEIPRSFRSDMRVPARLFANEHMLEDILHDKSLWQLVNVATLPGIQKAAYAMTDVHQGYGFPIGGVAATAIDEGGVICPGGIGFDLNCGIRLLTLDISSKEIKPYLEKIADALFAAIPSGVGRGGKLKLDGHELDLVLKHGSQRMIELGYGNEHDAEFAEEGGCMADANPAMISDLAKKRGSDQLGTLGSGNHFAELQYVEEIFDAATAEIFGLKQGQITFMIHCGSRGLGHQTCTDYVQRFMPLQEQWGIHLPDRELVCAPFTTQEAKNYFAAMCAAANFAWANRHLIGHESRKALQAILGHNVLINTLYDVSHNMGKIEQYEQRSLMVHRKGATRSFGPGSPWIPQKYQVTGQPVLIPGTMGTASYVLAGTNESMSLSFGSCCHGAGRKMSRHQAKRAVRGSTLRQHLEQMGILIRCDSDAGLAEEAPIAYKDIEEVVDVVHAARLAQKVARLKPLVVIKGG